MGSRLLLCTIWRFNTQPSRTLITSQSGLKHTAPHHINIKTLLPVLQDKFSSLALHGRDFLTSEAQHCNTEQHFFFKSIQEEQFSPTLKASIKSPLKIYDPFFSFFTPHSLHINVKQHITERLSICTPCCWFEEKSQSHKIVWHGLKLLNARVPVPWTRGELLNFWMEENSWTLNQRGAWLQCNLLWMEMAVEHVFRRSWSRCGIFSSPSELSVQTLLVCTQLLCAITWITICAQVNNSKPWQPYYCLDTWKYSTQPSKMECSCPSGTGTDNCYMQKKFSGKVGVLPQ